MGHEEQPLPESGQRREATIGAILMVHSHDNMTPEARANYPETAGTGPARCAFSVGLEFGDRPCAIAPMMPAYAKASAFAICLR